MNIAKKVFFFQMCVKNGPPLSLVSTFSHILKSLNSLKLNQDFDILILKELQGVH